MIDLVFRILYLALWLFDVALLIYVAMSWLRPTANRWTELLRKIVEPVLNPIRRILVEKLPPRWQIFDWYPLVAWLLVELVRYLLSTLRVIL